MPMLKTIAGHTSARGICRYLTHKNRALASDYINIDVPEGSREFDWAETMDTTRRSFGNDLPWRGKRVRTYKHYVVSPDPKDGIALEALRDLATSWAQEHFSEYTPHSERPHDAEPERHGAGPSAARGRLERPRADPHRPGGGRGAPRGLSVGSRRLPRCGCGTPRRPPSRATCPARGPSACTTTPSPGRSVSPRARPGPACGTASAASFPPWLFLSLGRALGPRLRKGILELIRTRPAEFENEIEVFG